MEVVDQANFRRDGQGTRAPVLCRGCGRGTGGRVFALGLSASTTSFGALNAVA
jgi:hypothetical protein